MYAYTYMYIFTNTYIHTHIYMYSMYCIYIYIYIIKRLFTLPVIVYIMKNRSDMNQIQPDCLTYYNSMKRFWISPPVSPSWEHFSSFGRKTSVTDTLSQSVTGIWVPLTQLACLHRFTHVSPFLFPFTWFYLTCSIVPGLKPHHRILHRLCAATMGAVRTFPHSNASIARHQCSITFILLDVYFVWILGWSADRPGAP